MSDVITLVNVEGLLEREIAQGLPQTSVALTYGWGILNESRGEKVDWLRMNAAILGRWPRGLMRVKKLAWKFAEEHGVRF